MLYEFRCEKCEAITEKIVKIGTKEIECPKCGAAAHKIISASNFNVKGFSAKNSYSHIKGKEKPNGNVSNSN